MEYAFLNTTITEYIVIPIKISLTRENNVSIE